MKSSLTNPTKAEQRRFYILKFEIGCLVHRGTPAEAHHLLRGGNRISHGHTIPLCPDCHWAIHNRKAWFTKKHGNDADLLAEADRKVAAFERNTIGAAA